MPRTKQTNRRPTKYVAPKLQTVSKKKPAALARPPADPFAGLGCDSDDDSIAAELKKVEARRKKQKSPLAGITLEVCLEAADGRPGWPPKSTETQEHACAKKNTKPWPFPNGGSTTFPAA